MCDFAFVESVFCDAYCVCSIRVISNVNAFASDLLEANCELVIDIF